MPVSPGAYVDHTDVRTADFISVLPDFATCRVATLRLRLECGPTHNQHTFPCRLHLDGLGFRTYSARVLLYECGAVSDSSLHPGLCVARAPIYAGTRARGMSVAAGARESRRPLVVRFGVSMALLGLAYFLLLTGLYVWVIEPIWSYLPLISAISTIKFTFCCILVSALSGFLSDGKPSQFYFMLCVLLIFVPSMTIYVCTDGSEMFLAMVLLAFAVLGLTLAIPPLSLPSVPMKLSTTGVAMVLLALSAVILSAIALKGGIASFNLNPMAVYDFRDQATRLCREAWRTSCR